MVLLPTLLRDFVPAVHQALLDIALALRTLEGQVVSAAKARRFGIIPGSRVVEKRTIADMHKILVRGLVLLEGSFPVSHLNPALHHLVHYAVQTASFGSLR